MEKKKRKDDGEPTEDSESEKRLSWELGIVSRAKIYKPAKTTDGTNMYKG